MVVRPKEHKTSTPDISRRRMDHRQGKLCGNGSIDSVSTVA
jgi:hypothetical protein